MFKIFEKFRKKPENKENHPPGDSGSSSGHFTMMPEGMERGEWETLLFIGNVHGTARAGEKVSLLCPDGRIVHADLMHVYNKKKKELSSVRDQKAYLAVSAPEGSVSDWKYSVVSDIPFQIEAKVGEAVENPYLLGLLYELESCSQDQEYRNILFRELCHAHYIIPVYGELPSSAAGSVILDKGTVFSLPSLGYEGECRALPVFTDWRALGLWRAAFIKHKRQTMILTFPDALSIRKEDAVAVNPFGPVPFFMDPELIRSLESSSAYQRDFGEAVLRRVNSASGSKILLSYPAPNEETEALRERLFRYGESHREVGSIYFLLKDDGETRSYLVIVDIPEEAREKVFPQIYRSCRDVMRTIFLMDFITYEKADFAEGIMKSGKPVFERKREE